MSETIWSNTLKQFRDRVAGLEPVPAGVTAAAVSATFGLGLLTKVLAIASKRKDFAGDRELVRTLLDEGHAQSQIVSRLADEDIAAFHEYLDCLRRKQPTSASTRKAIAVPLNIARAAASGLGLCHQAKDLIHAFVAPDLGTAAALLSAAVRSTLLTVEFNLQQLPEDDPYRVEVMAELTRLSLRFRADR
ncbi:MAG: cyclodeaminase/cyclohydrolase family protein [Bryobacteraceae bacterium]|jgi:formiminotetrahydrofolate cyclodeaminase